MDGSNGFVFTDHMVTVSNHLWAVTSAVGAVLCFIVLVVIFVFSLHPSSRVHLDRVSFRLLKWALIANMFFGIFSAVGGSLTGPGFLCGFSIFVLQLTLEWSCMLLFAIALNLQLVVVHHVNGQKMEKYYIVGAALLALAITVPPYAAKQYGWDPLVQDCWYTNDNRSQRLAWQIGTQLLWTGLTVIGEVVVSIAVIVHMLRHQSRRRQLGLSSMNSAARSTTTHVRSGSTASVASRFLKPVDHANAYRGVIFRIGLYPMTSCIINLTSIMCVIHATVTDGVHTKTDYNVLLLSDFLYGGRAVVYALLAITDPIRVFSLWKRLYFELRERSYHTSSDALSSLTLTATLSSPKAPAPTTTTKITINVASHYGTTPTMMAIMTTVVVVWLDSENLCSFRSSWILSSLPRRNVMMGVRKAEQQEQEQELVEEVGECWKNRNCTFLWGRRCWGMRRVLRVVGVVSPRASVSALVWVSWA
ncbi:hypothetical protein BC835DRAFT_533554 [Cytidiella melzeri]|nr:hypothetical protein BC835DRAFT_533554 [Cytidiella melzeri]